MRSRRAVTGIDVGHHAVKIVRLEGEEAGDLVLTHWGVEEIAAVNPSDQDVSAALNRLLKRLGLRARALGRVATAVGGRDVHIRQALMPKLSPEDLRRALPYEARKHLPLENVSEPCLDFQILHDLPANGSGTLDRQRVLLVAAPRGGRDRLLAALDRSGIHPDVIDAHPLPLVNAVLEAHPEDAADTIPIILDLGGTGSLLAAVLPDGGLYSRALHFTGAVVTTALQEDLDAGKERAESAKRALAGPDWSQSAPQVEKAVVGLLGELAETVRFLRVKERAASVSMLYLTGGASLLPGLDRRLAETLGVEVRRPNPFRLVEAGKNGRPDESTRARLTGAMGLARWWS